MWGMRKRYRVLLLAAIVAAFIVPVGFALSLESGHVPRAAVATTAGATTNIMSNAVATTAAVVAAPVVISGRTAADPAPAMMHPATDAAKLLLVGTVLFGLAAAVRKAV
jgi:hypothetical protein